MIFKRHFPPKKIKNKKICAPSKKMTYSSSGRGNIQDVAEISDNTKQES